MSLSEKNDSAYWQFYRRFVTSLTGESSGDRMVFLCSESTQCATASTVLPMAITNRKLFNDADGLLDPKTPFFDGAHAKSYFEIVRSFLNDLNFGGDQSENAVKALKDREGEYNTAFENLEATIKKAREHWLAIEVEEGEPAKPAFNKWQVTEYSPLDTAEEEHTRTFLAFREAALVVNGPRGEQYADAVKMMDEVRKAALKNLEIPGVVMAVSDESPASVMELMTAARAAGWKNSQPKEPDPEKCHFVAQYSLEGYRTSMDQWFADWYGKEITTKSLADFAQSEHTKYDDDQSQEHADASANLFGLFQFGGGEDNKSLEKRTFSTHGESSKFTFTFRYKHAVPFQVVVGKWDVPDMYETFKSLVKQDKDHQDPKYVYRPVQFLCVDGFGMTVKLEGDIKDEFEQVNKSYEEKAGGAGFKFGCFGISAAAGKTDSSTHSTHDMTYNQSTGEINIEPRQQYGTSTLLAVVAHKTRV